jgi:hypothetical protein
LIKQFQKNLINHETTFQIFFLLGVSLRVVLYAVSPMKNRGMPLPSLTRGSVTTEIFGFKRKIYKMQKSIPPLRLGSRNLGIAGILKNNRNRKLALKQNF